jgi:hypothetical protein
MWPAQHGAQGCQQFECLQEGILNRLRQQLEFRIEVPVQEDGPALLDDIA